MDPLFTPMFSLQDRSLDKILDNLDTSVLGFYDTRQGEVSDETLPNFGPVKNIPPLTLIRIIEELISREELTYRHLRLLLPRGTKSLTCDENTEFSPFQPYTIELISKRCPDFEELHLHKLSKRLIRVPVFQGNRMLRESILLLKKLKEINLYDCQIKSETIRVIATNCSELIELNLLGTNLTDEGLNYLYDEESVVKNSLTKLIIDETNVSVESVGHCLFNLQDLTYFQFDRTIEACLFLFEGTRNLNRSKIIPKFKTTIFKSILFYVNDDQLMNKEFQNWLIEKFPEVNHLILIEIKKKIIPFVDNLIRSWKHISHLELSSPYSPYSQDGNEENFNLLKPTLEACSRNLTNLKLEKFYHVDIFYLGAYFMNLKKLSLINNWFSSISEFSSFRDLKEIEIFMAYCKNYPIRIKSTEGETDYRSPWDLSEDNWRSLLSSENLENVFIYNQQYLTNSLFIRLLEMGCLRNLKEFKVFYCQLRRDGILRLFEERIPVKKIVVGFCADISSMDGEEISRFIKRNNHGTTFSMVMENPYYLRWVKLDEAIL